MTSQTNNNNNSSSMTGTTVADNEQLSAEEAEMNTRLSKTVVEVHEQLASQIDVCNNLLTQFASIRHISSTPYGCAGAARVSLMNSLSLRRSHPNWTNRLNCHLHASISECVENLRQFSTNRLPALARQFDRAQSSKKDDVVALLVADFEFSLAVDSARHSASVMDRYWFDWDDRALVASHLRRMAALLDAELERLTNLVGFGIEDNNSGGNAAMSNSKAKMRRHSFALKGSSSSSSSKAKSNISSNTRMSISLEPCLKVNTNNNNRPFNVASSQSAAPQAGGAGRLNVLPDWSVELALARLHTGGGRFF